ncbi:MAG: hypothetical protein ACOCX3_04200 [Chloroflexota bacterium]
MVLEIRGYIQLRGNNPLDAVVTGTHHKAYLVANLALKDGPQAAADHYDIGLASVHGAMTFYYDHEAAINESIRAAHELWRFRRAQLRATMPDETPVKINVSPVTEPQR